MTERR